MANNKRIRLLRGDNVTTDDNKKSTELEAGQPVYDTTKHILRIGSGKANETTINTTKPLCLEDEAVLGTPGASASRKVSDVFETGSNTVKNATNATNAVNATTTQRVAYTTVAPSESQPSGELKVCLLDTEPTVAYNGVLYLISL